jgi:hypothetical protein
MDAGTAPFGTDRTSRFQSTLGTGVFWNVNNTIRDKGHFLFRWTANDLPIPIQKKYLLGEALSLANRPGFAINLQLVTSPSHQVAAEIRPVDMEFFQNHLLPLQIGADVSGHAGFWDIGRRDGLISSFAWRVVGRKFLLESFVKHFVPRVTEKDT